MQYTIIFNYAASAAEYSHAGPISSANHESQWSVTGWSDYYYVINI